MISFSFDCSMPLLLHISLQIHPSLFSPPKQVQATNTIRIISFHSYHFKMPATRIPIHLNSAYKANGLKSYLYAVNKYDITPTHTSLFTRNANKRLMMKAADGGQHEVTSDNQQNDAFFTSPTQIGNPPQTLPMVYDSGSADTWVWSTYLSPDVIAASEEAGGEKGANVVFDPSKSDTFKQTKGKWQIQYGDQSTASGTTGTDDLKVGDIVVQKQTIQLADQLSPQFAQSYGSGLFGLSFGKLNTVVPGPVKTPVENMIAQNDIKPGNELWTVYLGSVKDVQDPDKGESFFTFGAIDQAPIEASGQDVHYVPIDNSKGFWTFDSPTATVNGQTIPLEGNTAIADTGTTLLMVSDELCQAIYGQIQGAVLDEQQGGWIFPADIPIDQLPQVSVAIGDKLFNVEKEHLAFAPVDDSGSMTYGGIQSRGNLGFDIFGDTFLLGVYAIFDVGKKQFGCVQRADPTPSGPDSASPGQKLKAIMKKAGEKVEQKAK